MCDCANATPVVGRSHTTTCEAITTEILQLYKSLIACIITNGDYTKALTNDKECTAADVILQNWLTAKETGDGCEYLHYLPILQELVKRIILSGICK